MSTPSFRNSLPSDCINAALANADAHRIIYSQNKDLIIANSAYKNGATFPRLYSPRIATSRQRGC